MSLSPSQSRTVTELDHVRISNLLRRQPAPGGAASAIEVLLDNADLVPSQDVAPDVVTMYTRVRVVTPQTGVQRELTVCYPPDADVATGFVSVLSPVGAALLGVSAGSTTSVVARAGTGRPLRLQNHLPCPQPSGELTK